MILNLLNRVKGISLLVIIIISTATICSAQLLNEVKKKIDRVNEVKDIIPHKKNEKRNKKKEDYVHAQNDSSLTKTNDSHNAKTSSDVLAKSTDNKFFFKSELPPKLEDGYSRLPIAGNLMIDIKGTYPPYPANFKPSWAIVEKLYYQNVHTEKYLTDPIKSSDKKFTLSLVTCENKPALYIKGLTLGGKIAFLDVSPNENIVINETPKKFRLTGFFGGKIEYAPDGNSVKPYFVANHNDSMRTDGSFINLGWDGSITIVATKESDILVGIDLFGLTNYKSVIKKQGNNIGEMCHMSNTLFPNLMTPEMAYKYIKDQKAEFAAAIEREKREKKTIDSLIALVPSKFPKYDCKPCFERIYTPIVTNYDVQHEDLNGRPFTTTKTAYDKSIAINNKCNQQIIVVGIGRFGDSRTGYHYELVSKIFKPHEGYTTSTSNILSILTSGEPDMDLQDNITMPISMLTQWVWVRGLEKMQ